MNIRLKLKLNSAKTEIKLRERKLTQLQIKQTYLYFNKIVLKKNFQLELCPEETNPSRFAMSA